MEPFKTKIGFYDYPVVPTGNLQQETIRALETISAQIDELLKIFLHGTKKKEPAKVTKEQLKAECPVHNKKRPCPICEVPRKPDPWEAWKADAPNPNNYNRWENWAIDVTNWIREMLRGK